MALGSLLGQGPARQLVFVEGSLMGQRQNWSGAQPAAADVLRRCMDWATASDINTGVTLVLLLQTALLLNIALSRLY